MTATFSRRIHALGLIVGLCAGGTRSSHAQSASTDRSAVVITGRDMAILGGGTLGAAALSMFDVRISRYFADSSLHARHGLEVIAKRTSLVTETLLMLSGTGVWALARLGHSPGTADVAFHTTESVASGAAFIQVIRGIGGRARPYVVNDSGETRDSDPYDFEWLKGFTSFNYRSFPSMHAMASFAAATALSQEMRVRNTRGRQVLSPLLYVAATATPMARLYLDEHWASDIALGVVLGVFAGQKVVIYSHEHPTNRVDRFFLRPQLRAGVTIDANGTFFRLSPF
jgi:membrane-associated phospholipid phosphatase